MATARLPAARAALIAVLSAPGTAIAGGPANDCHPLEDPHARLACYDRATARPARAAAPPPLVAPPPTVAADTPVAAAPAPAVPPAEAPSPRGRPATSPLTEPLNDARIVEILTTSIGRRQFLLENGELWEQLEAQRVTLRKGDVVDVRPTLFGAWQMRDSAGKHRAIKVRRAN